MKLRHKKMARAIFRSMRAIMDFETGTKAMVIYYTHTYSLRKRIRRWHSNFRSLK